MRRRKFITLIGVAAAWPGRGWAQQTKTPVIGFLNVSAQDQFMDRLQAFHRGLSEIGYLEGRNVTIEYRWADGQYDRLPAMAIDLVRRDVDVIAALGDSAALAAKAATSTIPIVFTGGNDPIKLGLVSSLNRPGGNITGATNLNVEIVPKRLEVLHEAIPSLSIVAVLVNPTGRNAQAVSRQMRDAASHLGVELRAFEASTEAALEAVFADVARQEIKALVIGADAFFNSQSEKLAALSIRYSLPAIFQTRAFAAAGGLISYGSSLTEPTRWVGIYAGRILKGEKPSSLPVQQSINVELYVNLKTAKLFGINLPLSLLARADEVIE